MFPSHNLNFLLLYVTDNKSWIGFTVQRSKIDLHIICDQYKMCPILPHKNTQAQYIYPVAATITAYA
jgi:hypothetical protein